MNSVEFGLQSNWLDMAKLFFDFAADGISSYEDCRIVETTNVLQWVKANTNSHQKECLSDSVKVLATLKKAIADMKSRRPLVLILADWLANVQALNTLAQTCMWE